MTFPKRSHRNFRRSFVLWILPAFALAAVAGCSDSQTSGSSATNMNHVLPSGESVPGWLVVPSGGTHSSTATQDFIANGSSGCAECHGSDLKGGISGTSCFGNPAGCHHGPVTGWVANAPAVQQHGVSAKKAPGSSGFVSCQICHAGDFSGGGANVSCMNNGASCHGAVASPHAPAPWRGAPYTHTDTNEANASVCARCHFPNSPNNPANHPASPAPAGTAPGCFNSTLCHGEAAAVPHPVGATWVATSPAAQPHGNDAKAAPGGTTGFNYCKGCHGSGTAPPANFGGGASGVSCISTAGCHGATVASPHPSAPWRASAGSTYNHTNVSEGNAATCQECHFPNSPNNPPNHPATPAPAGTPAGCFNNTLCHGAGVPHPVGATWVAASPAPQPHGNDAKAAPSSTAGFGYCQDCHGTGTTPPANFGGGSSGVSCLNTAGCHGATVASPHPSAPWRTSAGSTYNHTNVNGGNAAVCQQCHFPNSPNNPPNHPPSPAPAGTPAGCFNGTLCHAAPGSVAHPVPFNDTAHFSVNTGAEFSSCSSCHNESTPSTGPACQSCHAAASPLAAANCTSCHASPPDGGAGATYANIAGAHVTHIGLSSLGTPISCNTCHNGLGSGTQNHYDRAKSRVPPGDLAFLTDYNAQSGASSFSAAALTCSNVSCHGGQATPNWQTGTLNVNTQCTNCHTDGTTAQFNGPTSTNHNRGPHQAAACTDCHNTTPLAVNHFGTLATPVIEGPASATIGGGSTEIPAGNYNPATRSCSPNCHGNETW